MLIHIYIHTSMERFLKAHLKRSGQERQQTLTVLEAVEKLSCLEVSAAAFIRPSCLLGVFIRRNVVDADLTVCQQTLTADDEEVKKGNVSTAGETRK